MGSLTKLILYKHLESLEKSCDGIKWYNKSSNNKYYGHKK